MDANKCERYAEIDFRLVPCCSFCCYGDFEKDSQWGNCIFHTYDHNKHNNDEPFHLSIHRAGRCKDYISSGVNVGSLGDYSYLYRA